jgi:UDP-N-acetylglucosamine:LPS N-acetylglucosamine transferase
MSKNPQIQIWDTDEGKWVRLGTYLDMKHALRNLKALKEAAETEYRIDPDTVPAGWSYDQAYDEWTWVGK